MFIEHREANTANLKRAGLSQVFQIYYDKAHSGSGDTNEETLLKRAAY